jgi:hypothetical protein
MNEKIPHNTARGDALPTRSVLDYALRYAALGWAVVPCALGQKEPDARLAPRGVYSASVDRATLARWFDFAARNLAVAVANDVSVVDVDPRNGGIATMQAWVAERGSLPLTPRQRSGSGGVQLLFRRPAGALRGKLGPGVDLLNEGRYFIAAPSIHPNGKRYSWIVPPCECAIAPMPEWLAALSLRGSTSKAPVLRSDVARTDIVRRARAYASTCEPAISGAAGSHVAFAVVDRIVRGFDLSDDEACEALAVWNARCVPPWNTSEGAAPEDSLLRLVRRARERGGMPMGKLLAASERKR